MPNSLRFKNKVAVVTGAGSGIGRATALLLAREGAAVVAGVHKSSDAAPLEEKAQGLPGKLAGVQIDVTRDEDAQRLIGTAVERFGGLNILVNNAGIVISGTVTEATDEDLQRLLDVNLKGVFLCCKYGVQEMLKRGGGSIVNNSSINGLRGNHRLAAYGASKGAVVSLTRAMALDHAPQNIRVNCVCPASIENTRMLDFAIAESPDEQQMREYLLAKHPIGRLGRPEEVAHAILFLASDEASFITGVALPIDGGRSIR